MPQHELQRAIDELYAQHRANTNGDVATYIPELGNANPEDFGIAIATADGDTFQAGDCDRPFTIQSISKPFTFGMAFEAAAKQNSPGGSASSPAEMRSIRSSSRTGRTGRTIR